MSRHNDLTVTDRFTIFEQLNMHQRCIDKGVGGASRSTSTTAFTGRRLNSTSTICALRPSRVLIE